ncbi:MAG: TPM domain-containing protein [Taibaiella sp.]|nr:TPM domain-containing protein [Taibaiella sp.]
MFSIFKQKPQPLLSVEVQQKVIACIEEAESRTSGEIRVYVETKCTTTDPLDRAKEIFRLLEMEKTTARNAVLVYLAVDDKKFALFGDKVIYEKAGGCLFWEKAAERLKSNLRNGQMADGLVSCIQELGSALAHSFPHDPAVKRNELPNDIQFGQ